MTEQSNVHAVLRLAAVLAAVCAISTSEASAQEAAQGPITIIVPYTPGANTPDIVARLVGREMQQRLGAPVVIENKPGASGNIGTLAAARAASDGHTLLMVAPAFAQNVGLFKDLPYDPVKSFAPIIEVAEVSMTLAIRTALPAKSMGEFIEYARARPGRLNYASPGNGTPHHLSMELLKLATGIEIVHVPYRGAGPAVQDLIGGRVDAMFLPAPVSIPLARKDKIRLLAVAGETRSALAPQVPTLAEQGVKGAEVNIWIGLLAPAATPREIVARYNSTVNEILRSPRTAESLGNQGIRAVGGTPERFGELIGEEVAKWIKVVKQTGIAAE